MPSPLNDRFCLKGDRGNFTMNFRTDPADRAAYFGENKINDKIIQDIHDCYLMGKQPKKYLYGQYGAGKTHTLFNIKYQLEESPAAIRRREDGHYEVRCCFIDAEFREKTSYNYLHAQMMEALTLEEIKGAVHEYLATNAGADLETKLRNDFGDANIARAIRGLGYSGEPITLWKWLCGGTLTAAELNSFNLTKNMDTISEMYRVLVGVAKFFVDKKIYYLFLIDEMEGLQNIGNTDCRQAFHDAFKKLSDDDNSAVGFIVSIYAMQEEEIPEFVFTEDIKTRLNRANIHGLDYLAQDRDIRAFLSDLFGLVVDEEKRNEREEEGQIPPDLANYPLTDGAMDQLVELATGAPTASLPRNFISALNEAAVRAARRESYVIDGEDVKEPGEAIFTEDF